MNNPNDPVMQNMQPNVQPQNQYMGQQQSAPQPVTPNTSYSGQANYIENFLNNQQPTATQSQVQPLQTDIQSPPQAPLNQQGYSQPQYDNFQSPPSQQTQPLQQSQPVQQNMGASVTQDYQQLQPNTQNWNPQSTPQVTEPEEQLVQQPPQVDTPVVATEPKKVDDNKIGTHQLDVNINQDYAEAYTNAWQQPLQSPSINLNRQPEPQNQFDIAHPPTSLVVDNQFSDASLDPVASSNMSIMQSFDDSTDDDLLLVNDSDDEDLGDETEEHDNLAKFGFSDFDPNEQATGATVDDLATFETQSLAQTSDGIDADWSESMPAQSNQQQVGVLEPQQNIPVQQNEVVKGDLFNQPNFVNNYLDQRAEVANTAPVVNTPQVQPMPENVSPVNTAETSVQESPAARLNQLLEVEEAAEKVIMEKQDTVIAQTSATKPNDKSHIYKQINSDAEIAPEMQQGMQKKSSSKYFLILSLIIVISVIGFLLVLLGLSLLE